MAADESGNGEIGGGSNGGAHVVQVNNSLAADEISPLLVEVGNKPARMSIFSVSYSRSRSQKDASLTVLDAEVNFLSRIIMWVWNGSRYSGLLCVAFFATIFYIMEVLMDIFQVQSVPLFESVFTRCTIILILSVLWLRRSGLPLIAPAHIKNLLILRSLSGFFSLLSFIYSVKRLSLSYAICLNFTTPIMASIAAKIILQEKLALSDIGGLSLSYLGLLFIFRPSFWTQGDITTAGEMSKSSSITGGQVIYPLLLGVFSSFSSGICYCFIRAAAKASDHPVYSVFSFALLASPMSAICALLFQEFILPNVFTFILMVVLGVLAFFAEMSLARGLQLEKMSRATNMMYIQVILSVVWSMSFLGTAASFNKLIGCLLILASVCSTLYLGPEKEPNDGS